MRILATFAVVMALGGPLAARPVGNVAETPYARLADTVLSAKVIATAAVRDAERIGKPVNGRVRALITADLVEVITAPGELPARVEFLWDGPADARGRPAVAKGAAVLLMAEPVDGQPGQLRLAGPDALQTADAEGAVRAVLADARRPGMAGLRVAGVRDALFSAGTVAGESESQFFLENTGAPLTLVVTRATGAQVQVRLATGELIDDSAAPVQPRTLLWRALACGLPRALPARLAGDAALARDYAAALGSLGDCGR